MPSLIVIKKIKKILAGVFSEKCDKIKEILNKKEALKHDRVRNAMDVIEWHIKVRVLIRLMSCKNSLPIEV